MEYKSPNKFKAFYNLNKLRRNMDFNSMDFKHLEEPFIQLLMDKSNQEYNDSFDQMVADKQKDTDQEAKQHVAKNNHIRSHSCPYITPNFQERMTNRQAMKNIPEENWRKPEEKEVSTSSKKIRRLNTLILPFAKRSQQKMPRNSLQSSSGRSVVIHNNLASSLNIQITDSPHPLSSMLYSQKKNQAQRKAIPKVSRKYFQNTGEDQWGKSKYLKIKLQQQIKKYQLNNDLKKLEKETTDINIKQTVLEGILRKSKSQTKYLGYQTNQSFMIDEHI